MSMGGRSATVDGHLSNNLFSIEIIPKWSENYVPLLTIGQLNIPLPIERKQALIRNVASFVMLARWMYTTGVVGVLRLCIEPQETPHYLTSAHVTIGGIHMAGDQTLRRVLWAGVWWPTMKEEVYDFVRTCEACKAKLPHPYATLFQVSIAPKWSQYIVKYLEQCIGCSKRLVEQGERPLNLNPRNMKSLEINSTREEKISS